MDIFSILNLLFWIAIVSAIAVKIHNATKPPPPTAAEKADKVFGKRSADIEIYTPKKGDDDAS